MKTIQTAKNIHLVAYQRLQDALKNATYEDIARYHDEYLQERTVVLNSLIEIAMTAKKVNLLKQRILKSYMNKNSSNILWVHRYNSVFEQIKESDYVLDYFLSLFESTNLNERLIFQKNFAKSILKNNYFAYVQAEILRPSFILFCDLFERRFSKNKDIDFLLYSLRVVAEIDFRLLILCIEELTSITVNKKHASVENALLCLITKANSDKIQNLIGPMLNDFEPLCSAVIKRNSQRAEKIAGLHVHEHHHTKAQELVTWFSKTLTSHQNGSAHVENVFFSIEHIFGYWAFENKIKLQLDFKNKKTSLKMAELSFFKALFYILENAKDAEAQNITISGKLMSAGLYEIWLSNDGEKMGELEQEHCKKKFFSTRNKPGLGLWIANQEVERYGGSFYFEINRGFVFTFYTQTKGAE